MRAGNALVVDAAVLVEAAVLDRDDRLLHDRGDLVRLDQHAALVVGEGRQAGAVAVDDDRVLGALELGAVLQGRKVARDGRHDAEDPRDEREEREAHEDEGGADLLQAGLGAVLGVPVVAVAAVVASPPGRTRNRRRGPSPFPPSPPPLPEASAVAVRGDLLHGRLAVSLTHAVHRPLASGRSP